jgi:predicted amidohydrolase
MTSQLRENKAMTVNALQDMYLKSLDKLYGNTHSKQSQENAFYITQSYIGNIMTGELGTGENINFELVNDAKKDNHFMIQTVKGLQKKKVESVNKSLFKKLKTKTLNSLVLKDLIQNEPKSNFMLSRENAGDIIARCKKVHKKIVFQAKKDFEKNTIGRDSLEYVEQLFNTHIEALQERTKHKKEALGFKPSI